MMYPQRTTAAAVCCVFWHKSRLQRTTADAAVVYFDTRVGYSSSTRTSYATYYSAIYQVPGKFYLLV